MNWHRIPASDIREGHLILYENYPADVLAVDRSDDGKKCLIVWGIDERDHAVVPSDALVLAYEVGKA